MEKTERKSNRSKKERLLKQPNSFLRYSNLAIQMVVTIGLLGFIGFKIDGWLNLEFPIFLIILTFIGLFGMIYKLFKILNADN